MKKEETGLRNKVGNQLYDRQDILMSVWPSVRQPTETHRARY